MQRRRALTRWLTGAAALTGTLAITATPALAAPGDVDQTPRGNFWVRVQSCMNATPIACRIPGPLSGLGG